MATTTDKNRIESLNSRYERLIAANQANGYIHSDKSQRYLKCIAYLKEERVIREAENRLRSVNSPVSKFLRASSGLNGMQILTKAHLFALTSPQ